MKTRYFYLKNLVKKVRIQRHMTQKDLSELTGLSVNSISSIENGESFPNLYNAFMIARHLDCEITDLFYTMELFEDSILRERK